MRYVACPGHTIEFEYLANWKPYSKRFPAKWFVLHEKTQWYEKISMHCPFKSSVDKKIVSIGDKLQYLHF
jgi:hypothetical protein